MAQFARESSDHTYLGYKARNLDVEFGDVYEEDQPAPVAGGTVSPSLPANVSPAVTWVGAAGAAPRRGRVYILPPCESQVVGQLLDAAVATNIQTAFAAINDSIEPPADLNAAQVIVSRYSGSSLVGPDEKGQTILKPTKRGIAVTNTISATRVNRRIDTQRRRLNAA